MRHQPQNLVAYLLFVSCTAIPFAASATESCEDRYSNLNVKYSTAYIDLENECYPRGAASEDGSYVELSPECVDKYNNLGNEMNREYTAFYEECGNVLFPQPVDETPTPEPTEISPEEPQPPIETPIVDPVPGSCDQRLAALNDRFTSAYVDLDAECYPADGSSWCGFELSQDCQERYLALGNESAEAYNALYEECYNSEWKPRLEVDPPVAMPSDAPAPTERSISAEVFSAPTKKEMLSQIKTLKKQLRRAKASNKKMRARCRK